MDKLQPRDRDGIAVTRQGDDLSQWGILTEALPEFAPGSKLNWSLFLLVFAGNVVAAVVAWVMVGLFIR
jgi:hypothetical protein